MASRPTPPGRVATLDDALLRRWPLPIPGPDGDKEDRGRVLVIGGSFELSGAIVLAAIAALRAGAGKLTVATAARAAPMVAQSVCEARVIALAETGDGSFARRGVRMLPEEADCVLVGPGMESNARNCEFAAAVCGRYRDARLVLDAGAMDAIKTLRRRAPGRAPGSRSVASCSPSVLLTPHAGELAHLCGGDKTQILGHPEDAVLAAARRWGAMVALKGQTTLIGAPDGRLWRHDGGNVGLATSGSGDVLAGIIAGLAARGATLEQASAWGVALHARAGENLVARIGLLGCLAREIGAEVPRLMHALGRKRRS